VYIALDNTPSQKNTGSGYLALLGGTFFVCP